ncbi:MAG: histidinol-phosphate transaminase, partial [Anaerolineae bacterium]|nr:histidinol-phosphate transaminase [Anaerolineae bacterium]
MTTLRLHAAPPAYHGAIDYAELERLGLDPAQIIDFSVNSNPYGPSARVRQAIAATPPDRYPDRESLALRRALAGQLDLPIAKILIGNGAAEILWLIALAFIRPGDRVLVIEPTFGEYARLAALLGAEVLQGRTGPETGFQPDCEAITGYLTKVRPRVMFLCNPNNPTGVTLPVEQIAVWAKTQPETLFVIDEAYLAFAPPAKTALAIKRNNLLIVRSMTKDYALAGLRLGYVVSHNQELIERLTLARPAWNVNALAQAAGLAALADEAHQQRSLEKLID